MTGPNAADREWMRSFAAERLKATEGWDADLRAAYLDALGRMMAHNRAQASAYIGRPKLVALDRKTSGLRGWRR